METILWILIEIVVFILVFVAFFVLGIRSLTAEHYRPLRVKWTDKSGKIHENIEYDHEKQLAFDLYIPAGLDQSKDQALILFIHGGGFTSGNRKDEDVWCKFFASKGYITATASYPLMTKDTPANLNEMNEKLLLCVQKIVTECDCKGYQLTQMALSGQSAGGCLAMLYAYRNRDTSPLPVRFVFQQTGPASFEPRFWSNTEDQTDEQIAASVTAGTGKAVTADMVCKGNHQALVDEISPAALVDNSTVPTLCAYGPRDKIVPVAIKFALFEAFDRHNIPYDFIEYPHSGHSMMSDPEKQELFIQKALEYCEKYFLQADSK